MYANQISLLAFCILLYKNIFRYSLEDIATSRDNISFPTLICHLQGVVSKYIWDIVLKLSPLLLCSNASADMIVEESSYYKDRVLDMLKTK